MEAFSNKSSLFVVLFFLFSCGKDGHHASSYSYYDLSSQRSKRIMRWNIESLPLQLRFSEDFQNDFLEKDQPREGLNTLDKMLVNWDKSIINKKIFNIPAQFAENRNYETLHEFNDDEIGVYKSYKWFDDLPDGVLAITQYFGLRRNKGTSSEYLELIHADIIFNYRDYIFTMNENESFHYDLPSVLLHELGHLLGLPHHNETKSLSIMTPFLNSSDIKRNVYLRDQENLQDNYLAQPQIMNQNSFLIPKENKKEALPQIERGVIELNAWGECWLKQGGKKKFLHKHKI
ncbi:MAG: hypothetical protein CME68_09720 [Halobacteriovoraceae bacterium]|nr:hypothetical protein [Halobacteriovoraceae bacterium]